MVDIKFTQADVGCYVDESRGLYSIDAIVAFVNSYGANIKHDPECPDPHVEICFDSEFAGCPYSSDYEDDANAFMNKHHAVDNCYWGRDDSGNWGLWRCDSE